MHLQGLQHYHVRKDLQRAVLVVLLDAPVHVSMLPTWHRQQADFGESKNFTNV